MVTVEFSDHFIKFGPCQSFQVEAKRLDAVITKVFQTYPHLKTYLVDEHNELHTHMTIFIGENTVQDRSNYSDVLEGNEHILIMQALSGG